MEIVKGPTFSIQVKAPPSCPSVLRSPAVWFTSQSVRPIETPPSVAQP